MQFSHKFYIRQVQGIVRTAPGDVEYLCTGCSEMACVKIQDHFNPSPSHDLAISKFVLRARGKRAFFTRAPKLWNTLLEELGLPGVLPQIFFKEPL